jgi:hypothetical protein
MPVYEFRLRGLDCTFLRYRLVKVHCYWQAHADVTKTYRFCDVSLLGFCIYDDDRTVTFCHMGVLVRVPEDCSAAVASLYKSCLEDNPELRPTASEIFNKLEQEYLYLSEAQGNNGGRMPHPAELQPHPAERDLWTRGVDPADVEFQTDFTGSTVGLGYGQYATVYLGRWQATRVAVKIRRLTTRTPIFPSCSRTALEEFDIQRVLRHPNVVLLMAVCEPLNYQVGASTSGIQAVRMYSAWTGSHANAVHKWWTNIHTPYLGPQAALGLISSGHINYCSVINKGLGICSPVDSHTGARGCEPFVDKLAGYCSFQYTLERRVCLCISACQIMQLCTH